MIKYFWTVVSIAMDIKEVRCQGHSQAGIMSLHLSIQPWGRGYLVRPVVGTEGRGKHCSGVKLRGSCFDHLYGCLLLMRVNIGGYSRLHYPSLVPGNVLDGVAQQAGVVKAKGTDS